jgi:uncharacterized damage-inducible protein DinB
MWENLLHQGLDGRSGHVQYESALEDLNYTFAGKKTPGYPHTIFQILNHMIFWQDFLIEVLRGGSPQAPEHAEGSWLGEAMPLSQDEWNQTAAHFLSGLKEVIGHTGENLEEKGFGRPERTRAEVLMMTMSHNSYHIGQVVMLRRILGSWPPPSGGDTW